jgi:mono/diheme cytochrome c family protein
VTRFAPGAIAAAIAIVIIVVAARASAAQSVFAAKCAICHQPDARGVPGMYPPLAGTIGDYLTIRGGRAYLADVVLFGMSGLMTAGGADYNGLMPPQGAELSDAEIAATLNDVLDSFNRDRLPRDFKPFTPAEIRAARAERRGPSDQAAERAKLLGALQQRGVGRRASQP